MHWRHDQNRVCLAHGHHLSVDMRNVRNMGRGGMLMRLGNKRNVHLLLGVLEPAVDPGNLALLVRVAPRNIVPPVVRIAGRVAVRGRCRPLGPSLMALRPDGRRDGVRAGPGDASVGRGAGGGG